MLRSSTLPTILVAGLAFTACGGAEAMEDVARTLGRQVVSGRNGVQVPGENNSFSPPPRGARDHRIAITIHREVLDGAHGHLDGVGDFLLVPALGVDVHQSCGEQGCVLANVESRHLGTVTM